MSNTIVPILIGSICGLECGPRPSGVTVARVEGGRNASLLFDGEWKYAPVLFALALSRGLRSTSDGRLVIMHDRPDPAADLAAVEAVLERGGPGGIRSGAYGSGVYTVSRTDGAWSYTVVCKPSGRASLKAIGVWTGVANTFAVPFADDASLSRLLERAETAQMKGATTTISLPAVSGVPARVEGGEILIGWPGSDDDAAILKAVPSMRWDKQRKAYAVSTRYSKRTIKALDELRGKREAVRQALAERLAEVALPHLTVSVSQDCLTARYAQACDGAYRALATQGRVEQRVLTVPLHTGTNVGALFAALTTAEAALVQAAAAKERAAMAQNQAKKQAAVETAGPYDLHAAPKVGAVFRTYKGVVVCTAWHEARTDRLTRRPMRMVSWREASTAETEAFLAAEASAPATGRETVSLDQKADITAGTVFRTRKGKTVTATWVSPAFFLAADNELATSFYPSNFWGQWVVDVDWTEAVADL